MPPKRKSGQEPDYERISITIRKDTLAEVDKRLGKNGNRSAFINEAIMEKLARDREALSGGPGGKRSGKGWMDGGEQRSGAMDLEMIRQIVREEINRQRGGGREEAGDGINDPDKGRRPETDGNKLAGAILDIFRGL